MTTALATRRPTVTTRRVNILHQGNLRLPDIPITDKIDEDLLNKFAVREMHPTEQGFRAWRQGAQDMMPHYTIAKVCLCMLAGEQWLHWDARVGTVQRLADMINWTRPNVMYAIMDRIKPAYRFKLGQLIDEIHLPEVVPAGERPDQFANARLQTQYAQALWWTEMLDDVHEEAMAWILATGVAFLKPYWDAKKGRASARCLSLFELMLLPYGIKRTQQHDAAIETQAVSLERLRDEYPESMDGFTFAELQEEYSTVLASTDTFLTSVGSARTLKNLLPVRDIVRRPTKEFPKGYRIRMVRQRLLELEVLKDPDLPAPFYRLAYDRFPGALWPPGMVQGEISKQFYYNKLFSDIIAYIHGQGVGSRLMLPDSLDIKDDDLNAGNRPIRYFDDINNVENRPYYLQRPNIPHDTFAVRDWLVADFDDSIAWHSVNRGKAPANIESGIGIQALQARDDQPTSPLRKKTSRQWSRAYSHMMTLTNRHWKGGKPLVGVDPMYSMPFAVEEFRKTKSLDPVLVYMRTVPITPYDRVANRQMIIELAQYGAMSDFSPAEIRQLVQYGVNPSMFGPKNMHRLVARRENNRILSGEIGAKEVDDSVKPWHDDSVHLEEHLECANHPDFEEKPTEMKLAMSTHVQMHLTNLATVRRQQMEELGMMRGAQGGAQGGAPGGAPGGAGQPMMGGGSAGQEPGEGQPMSAAPTAAAVGGG